MLDFSHIPINNRSRFDIFYGPQNYNLTQGWQTWNKPRGITNIYILCIGGGGGGGSGQLTGVSGAGGSGGSSGGITTVLIQAVFLPDVLYILPGYGGPAGSSGAASYVSILPSTTAAYVVGYANGGGGNNGQTAPGVAAAATITSMVMCSYGIYSVVGGQVGVAGTAGALGTNIAWGSLIVSSGASGGGQNGVNVFAGGDITGAGPMPSVLGGAGNVAGAGSNGRTGINFTSPFMFSGGSGGGASGTAAAGGRGGDGGYGCGGGGGGSVPTSGTVGAGGLGGPGLVAIWGF